MNIRDIIDIEIRNFRLSTLTLPTYIIVNRDDYFMLKEEIGYSFDKEIILFAGCDLLVTMDLQQEVKII
jgi:hypothetical protein